MASVTQSVMQTVSVKQEPIDDEYAQASGAVVSNCHGAGPDSATADADTDVAPDVAHTTWDLCSKKQTDSNNCTPVPDADKSKIICLFCNIRFDTRDQLRVHMTATHKTGRIDARRRDTSISSKDIAPLADSFTCATCDQKCRTLAEYISHQATHANKFNHIGGDNSAVSDAMYQSLHLGKFSLQGYIQGPLRMSSRHIHMTNVFSCNYCNATFTNRDAYAWHVMTRAMNDSCMPVQTAVAPADHFSRNISSSSDIDSSIVAKIENSENTWEASLTADIPRYHYEEVTDRTYQDEYLKAVVDNPAVSDNIDQKDHTLVVDETHSDVEVEEIDSFVEQNDSHSSHKIKENGSIVQKVPSENDVMTLPYNRDLVRQSATSVLSSSSDRNEENTIKCMFCDKHLIDQDSLAMHVMSDHAGFATGAETRSLKPSPTGMPQCLTTYMETTRMHYQPNALQCSLCAETFINRDALAMHAMAHVGQEVKTEARLASVTAQPKGELSRKRQNSEEIDLNCVEPKANRIHNIKASSLNSADDQSIHLPVKLPDLSIPPSGGSEKNESDNSDTQQWSSETFCNMCSIQFFSSLDLDWHMRCSHSPVHEQPLCLKTTSRDVPARTGRTFQNEAVGPSNGEWATEENILVRRSNSESGQRITEIPLIPTRPISTGQLETTQCRRNHSYDSDKTSDGDSKYNTTKFTNSSSANVLDNSRIQAQRTGISNQHNSSPSQDMNNGGEKSDVKMADSDCVSADHMSILQLLYRKRTHAMLCKYCEIIFLNKTVYHLHMGLHNVNNPWQCNMCGKVCSNVHEFSAHVIHY